MSYPDNEPPEKNITFEASFDPVKANHEIGKVLETFYNLRLNVDRSTKNLVQIVERNLLITSQYKTEQAKLCHSYLETVRDGIKNLELQVLRLHNEVFDNDVRNGLFTKNWDKVKCGLTQIKTLTQDVWNTYKTDGMQLSNYETPHLRRAWREAHPLLPDLLLIIQSAITGALCTFEITQRGLLPNLEYWICYLGALP